MSASERDDRPTIRPVTLARLVETTHVCASEPRSTDDLETALDVSHRRARETILEARRIGLIAEDDAPDPPVYRTRQAGEQFLTAVRREDWTGANEVLADRSPHYSAFLDALAAVSPASLGTILAELEDREAASDRTYNQTSVEVVGDWGERLGAVQRNAFTGVYYLVEGDDVPADFATAFLACYDDLEETAGVDLRQRYLSIPELREGFCERHGCRRAAFDDALRALARQNVGRIELSGAPLDTGAKDARLGIKAIALGGEDGLVTTTQSTERVMAGVEQLGKQYYYVAVHDRELDYDPTDDTAKQ